MMINDTARVAHAQQPLIVGTSDSSAVATLPPPQQETDSLQDAMAKLYAAMAALQNSQSGTATTDTKTNQTKQREAQRKRQEELDKAREAAEKGGFFKWLGSGMGATGLVALATGNPALLIASIVMHKSGMMKNTKFDMLDAAMMSAGPVTMAADLLIRKLAAPDLGKDIPGITDDDVKPVMDKVVMASVMVAGAALSVVTAGTTTALIVACIAIALSAGSCASAELGGPKELTMGLAIGSAVCSLGGSAVNAAQSLSAAGSTAAKASDAAAKAATSAAKAENTAKVATTALDSATKAANGTETIVNAIHQKESADATIRAAEFRNLLTKLERVLDAVIEGAKESQDSFKRITATVTGIVQTHNDTLAMSAAAIRG